MWAKAGAFLHFLVIFSIINDENESQGEDGIMLCITKFLAIGGYMSLWDLLFLFIILASAIALVVILVNLILRRTRTALRILITLASCLAIYFLIAAVSAISAPQRVLAMGQDRCFDELCFAVTGVKTAPSVGPSGREAKAAGQFYMVTVRMSSHARGRPQRELGVSASLIDSHGRTYRISQLGQNAYDSTNISNPSLTSVIMPGESQSSVQVFDVSANASGLSLVFGHSGLGMLILGDEDSALRKPAIIRLNPTSSPS